MATRVPSCRDRDAPDVVGLSVGLLDRAGLAGLQVPEPDRPVRVTRDQHLAVVREGHARVVRGIFLGVLQARPPRFARRRIPEVDDGAFPALRIESAPRGEDPSVRGEGQGPHERPFRSPVRPVERPRHPAGRGIPEGDLSPVLLWVEGQGGHGLTVRGRRQVPDGAPQRQRPDHRVPGLLRKPPEDMPLEAAPVRLIGSRGCGDGATRPSARRCRSPTPAGSRTYPRCTARGRMSARAPPPCAAWRSARTHWAVLTTRPATSVTTRPASRPATSLFRRPQRSSRSAEEARRARIGRSSRNRRRSSASSSADG